jgi:membrane protein YqaA with SNARE-associated domain
MNAVAPGLIAGVFATCLVSAVIPWMSGEVAVAAAVGALPTGWAGALVAAAAVGQMLGKLGLYALARWCPERLPARARAGLERLRGAPLAPRAATVAVFLGGAIGLPPLYLLTLAAGATKMPVARFALPGLAGVALRYGAIAWGAIQVAQTLT